MEIEVIALWHSEETAILGFWGSWLVIGGLVLGGVLVFVAYKAIKELGRRKD